MSDDIFRIGADGIETDAVVARIRERVAEKMERGLYTDGRVARAERTNLAQLRDREDFLAFYLDCLREAVLVDINDFEIHERRARFSRPLVLLKRSIWKLLKFYTYRLWSQQNQVNGLLLSAVESMDSRYREKFDALEKRIDALERKPS